MANEAPTGPSRTTDGRGHDGVGAGEQSPPQARAAFFKNRHWESVVSFNRGACAGEREALRETELTLGAALDELRSFHRKAPFLFFNGNTFAEIGRQMALAIFWELPAVRQKEIASAVAHYIAGVLDREAMVAVVKSLSQTAALGPGSRVKTLRGSLRGVITRVLEDGRVAVRPNGSSSEMISMSGNLLPDD